MDHPFFTLYREGDSNLFKALEASLTWPTHDQLSDWAHARAIRNAQGMPIVFIDTHTVFSQREYERHIYEHGRVPTRHANWHDFLNALVWLQFPSIKAALNAVHCQQPQTQNRSVLSDAATVFDESGAILVGPDSNLAQALIAHDWERAFVLNRTAWQTHRLIIIGHAVLEKSLNPYPGMITKTMFLQTQAGMTPLEIDQSIARQWAQHAITQPSSLFPLPVLGVPGCDPHNQNPTYYQNKRVFR